MSEKLPNNNTNEEVDLGILFNAIGNFFSKIINFIGGILKTIFSAVVFLIKAIVQNFKVISLAVILAFLIGFGLDKTKDPVYYAEMLVKPYFDSKYQLVSNIDYYNSLLQSKNYETLTSIFDVTEEEVQTIKKFEIDAGPKTENELLQDFDTYTKSIDSLNALNVTFDDFIENRDIYSSEVYSIIVKSTQRDIFSKLSSGFTSTFDNAHSKKLKQVRDSTIGIKKETYLQDLKKIDSLQMVYLDILLQESKNGALSIGLDGLLPVTQEKTPTREYDLFRSEVIIRDSIRALNQRKIEENVYYDVITNFSDIGLTSKNPIERFSLLLPALAILILLLIYILNKVIAFVRAYEG